MSPNPQLKGLSEIYNFLARRTNSRFNKVVAKRLILSKRNKAPVSLSKLAKFCPTENQNQNQIFCVVATVTDDVLLKDVPCLNVCALRFTNSAKRRIIEAGGKAMTFDELALITPEGKNCVLIRGNTKHREAEKHFGVAPGIPRSHTKPYACPKVFH